VGKLVTEVGGLAEGVDKLKEEGAGVIVAGVEKVVVAGVEKVVVAGIEKVVVAGVEAAGAGELKIDVAGAGELKIDVAGAGELKIDVAGAGDVNILWGAAGVAAICAGAGAAAFCTCTDDDGSRVACLKRRILYESYATTSSTTMNASIWSRIGIVHPGTAKAIVLSVAMITLTPSVSAYNRLAFKVKLMSDWSR